MSKLTSSKLQRLVERIGHRVGHHLERRDLLVCDAGTAAWIGTANTRRHWTTWTVIRSLHHCGRTPSTQKALNLKTLPAIAREDVPGELATAGGFTLRVFVFPVFWSDHRVLHPLDNSDSDPVTPKSKPDFRRNKGHRKVRENKVRYRKPGAPRIPV